MREPNTQIRPLLSVAITPWNSSDLVRLQQACEELAQKYPGISIETAPATLQSIVRGMDESHLKSICDEILKRELDIDVGEPKVIYLETIRRSVESEGKYIRQTGGYGNYGHVKIRLEPSERGEGFKFIDAIKDGVIPKEFISSIEQGIREALLKGVVGHEMVDLKVTLYDGSYHDVDSNQMAFKMAGAMAFKEAAKKASPVLLEPLMALEVSVPEKRNYAISGYINSRRGRILDKEHSAGLEVFRAIVPLAEVLGDSKHLDSLGAVDCSMRFIQYMEKPFGEEPGDYGAGVIANKPTGPTPKRGFAAADPESDWKIPDK